MGPCSVSTRSQSKPTDAISSATSGSPKFRRLPKHALPAASRCFTWLGVIGRQYSAGDLPPVEPCARLADHEHPKGDAPVRAGISLTSRHAVKDPRQGARWMIERARAAWEAGLDSLFLGDHHATAVPYYQNVPMLGRLLAEWGDRPAGCLFLLPLWNPVLVAEQVGTLAALARGRFILQCGLGDDESQFAAMGARLTTRPSAFEESLSIIRRLLAGEVVSSSGRFAVRDARVAPTPSEPVEGWIGASAEVSTERSGRWATPTSSSAISPTSRPRSSDRSRVFDACGRRFVKTLEGGFAPLPKPPPWIGCAGEARARSTVTRRADSRIMSPGGRAYGSARRQNRDRLRCRQQALHRLGDRPSARGRRDASGVHLPG